MLLFGIVLVALAAIDVYLLQRLGTEGRLSSSLVDNSVFDSEFSLVLASILYRTCWSVIWLRQRGSSAAGLPTPGWRVVRS